MNVSQVNQILKQLETFREDLKCTICRKQYENPVRIRVCGHYFCSQCLNQKKSLYSCPQCNMYFEERDIEKNNIGIKTQNILADLELCLQTVIHNRVSPCNPAQNKSGEEANVDDLESSMENCILNYQKKKYKLMFIEKLHDKINAKGETLLHIACKRKQQEKVIELIEKKLDINTQDFAGWTPLHEAVNSQDLGIIEYLLNQGALVNIPGEDYTTPLHKAVGYERIYVIKLLLKNGADNELIDLYGKKPVECTMNESVQELFQETSDCIQRVEQLFCAKQITAFCYYVENEYKDMLRKSNIKIQETYDKKKVTHFILRRKHKLSLKILIAILDGCIIVPQEWISQIVEDNDHFIQIPNYTFIFHQKLNEGIQKASMNKLLKLPKLFDNINFFIYGHKKDITLYNVKFSKDSIGCLITSGGGKLLRRAPSPGTCEGIKFPFHARYSDTASNCCSYIIYDEDNPPDLRYQMAEIKHKSSKWLVDCIISFTILD